jgi:hypothetical protein
LVLGKLAAPAEAAAPAAADAALSTGPHTPRQRVALQAAEIEAVEVKATLAGVGGNDACDWALYIDNHSGTYTPVDDRLAALLEHNFPGLRVVAVPDGNPEYVWKAGGTGRLACCRQQAGPMARARRPPYGLTNTGTTARAPVCLGCPLHDNGGITASRGIDAARG